MVTSVRLALREWALVRGLEPAHWPLIPEREEEKALVLPSLQDYGSLRPWVRPQEPGWERRAKG